jgi:tetratricopeptide (TPR) repeat protein
LKSIEFLQKSNQLFYEASANTYLGRTCLHGGDYKTCQKYHKRAISLWQNSNIAPSNIIWNKISLALARVMNKEKDINLNEIFKWYEDIRIKCIRGWVLNIIGEILLNIDDQHISEAEDWIKKSIETNQKYGMMWDLAQDYALYADLFNRKGNLPEAKKNLSQAIEIFKECGADGWVEKYEKELASLS